MDKYRAGLEQRPANYAPLTPISFLERSARVYPDKPAIIDGDRRISYREMFARCRRAADALRKAGVGSLDTVSVFAPNSVAMLEMHFAASMAGAVLNAINFRLDAPTVAFILDHAETKVFLFDSELAPVARAALETVKRPLTVIEVAAPNCPARGDFMEYEAFLASGDPEGRIDWPEDEWRAISLNYTSGTTGNPKGVVCHHRGAYLNALGQGLAVGLRADSVYLWTLPMFHCNGWTFTWGVTAIGGTHVVQRTVVPAEIFDKIDRLGVTHLCGAPTVLNMLAFAPGSETRRLKQTVTITTGGAAPTSTVIGAMERMGFVVMHAYGLTETYGPATLCELQPEWQALELAEKAKLIARQGVRYITAADLAVMDPETGEILPADGQSMGEICTRGNTVMMGYLKNPEASNAAFRDGWFHSGDLGVMHPDGYVEVKDRSKDIIISGGENISSLEVEEIMSRHPAIREVAVVAKPDSHWGETPCAFVTLRDGAAAPSGDELMAWCRENMAHFKRPHYVVFGELPKTVTGKVQKYLLRERAKGM
ncbi:MAG TPA: AMP-binding protein [Dongiaceae bacterium]|nr:AMP-binding protein [Dongiaceae bacterium]